MIIGIDGNEANQAKRVGIGEYAFELLRQFKQFTVHSSQFTVKIYLKDRPLADMPEETKNWKYVVVKPKKFWTQVGLPLKLVFEQEKPNVFFSPSHYAPRFAPMPTAIAIMDVSYLKYPELFKKKDLYQLVNWTKYSAKRAKVIFTISDASKNDILKAYGKRPEQVIVTYPGLKQPTSNNKQDTDTMDILKQKYAVTKPYILFVGTLQPRKNIVRLIEAFSQIKSQKDLDLVVVGKKGWLYEEILEAPKKYGVADRVKFLDFVSNEDLSLFYKNAELFILPSLYEGFGLPVIEAMSYGCPVITSSVSSLPEAGGDAAVFVDPESVSDIAKKLEKVLTNKKLRGEMIKKGYLHIKKFSWEKTARETLEALKSLAK